MAEVYIVPFGLFRNENMGLRFIRTFLAFVLAFIMSNHCVLADEPAGHKFKKEIGCYGLGCMKVKCMSDLLHSITTAPPYSHLMDSNTVKKNWESAGHLWGWHKKPTHELEYLKTLHVNLVSDPFTAKTMKLQVARADHSILKTIEIPWNPSLQESEQFYLGLKIKKPVYFKENPNATAVEKNLLSIQQGTLSFAEPRFIDELLEDTPKIKQSDWYTLEHSKSNFNFLTGKSPRTSLYEFRFGWHPPGHLTDKPIELAAIDHVKSHYVNVSWIKAKEDLTWDERVDLGLNTLLLDLKNFDSKINIESTDNPFAYSVHIDHPDRNINFHFVDLNSLEKRKYYGIEPQWQNAHETQQNFIAKSYQKNLGMDEATTKKLAEFTSANESRLQYFLMTEEPFSAGKPYLRPSLGPNIEPRIKFKQEGEIKKFNITGSLGIIYSKDPVLEPLSLEKYAGIKLNRKPGEKVAELIRLAVDPKDRDFGPKLMWKMCSHVVNTEDVSRVFAITDKVYAEQLINQFGFEKIVSRMSPQGNEEWVIQITPAQFFKRATIRSPK